MPASTPILPLLLAIALAITVGLLAPLSTLATLAAGLAVWHIAQEVP